MALVPAGLCHGRRPCPGGGLARLEESPCQGVSGGARGAPQGDLGAEPAPHPAAQAGGGAGQAQLPPGHEPLRGPGIFTWPPGQQNVTHGMLLVGYDTAQVGKYNVSYWILKNSWSEGWDDKGYMSLLKDTGNQCGVASDGSYPLP